jgi:hypothetical protein
MQLFSTIMDKALSIIGNPHDLNAIQELWFIQNSLFKGAPVYIGFDPKRLTNQRVVYLELNEINADLIMRLRNDGNKVIIYHMGDEFARMNRSQYLACDLVIRNYYFSFMHDASEAGRKTIWAPSGFKTGVGPRHPAALKKTIDRQWLGIFLGWLKNTSSFNDERGAFSKVAPKCGDNLFLMPSDSFGSGWNVGLYSTAMESAIFAPCPAGNSPETIRLYDALELGCIPISLSHEFLHSKDALGMIGSVPFPILDSWEQLPQFLEQMKAKALLNPDEILNLQQSCIDWWSNFKIAIQKRISERIAAL